jgi:hypothetical protein
MEISKTPISVLRNQCDRLCHAASDKLHQTTEEIWEDVLQYLRAGETPNEDEPQILQDLVSTAYELNRAELAELCEQSL